MDVRLLSVAEMLHDALDVFLNLESRVWRSLRPLLFAPGKLTNEYIAGRRTRYLPPFRTYLVFSLLFFLLISLPDFSETDGPADLGRGSPSGAATDAMPGEPPDDAPDGASDAAPGEPSDDVPAGASDARPADSGDRSAARRSTTDDPFSLQLGDGITIESAEDCDRVAGFVGWGLEARTARACRQIIADRGQSLFRTFADNIPLMLFVCVPIIAALMWPLYAFSRRKYVEHLTFLFHTHAFFFVFLTLVLFARGLRDLVPVLGMPLLLVLFAGWIYVPVYVFVAMRRVYKQGRLLTTAKYLLLGPIYFFCLGATFLAGLALTAVTL